MTALRPLAAALFLATSCASSHFVPLPAQAEIHLPRTSDGWQLELVRYKAEGPPRGRPVLMCAGISANARNLDLDDTHSLARWFAAHGREAWTMSLRASGGSDMPDAEAKRPTGFPFDVYWQQDLPAAIDEVRKTTGAEDIDYVGHSMGGMVVYAYLSQGGHGIHAASTLGSPTRLDWGTGLESLMRLGQAVLPKTWMIPSDLGSHLSVPVQGMIDDGPFQRFFYNPENTKLESWQRLMAYGVAGVSTGVAQQLLKVVETTNFTSADGTLDFRKSMREIKTPILVVGARLDRIALTPAVYDGYRALGGEKKWLLISRANGASAEYGHMDLVIGEYAPEDVWSKVLDFFDAHETNGPASGSP
jgi:pimeloyl-ACP methyl ester carboxylesterase